MSGPEPREHWLDRLAAPHTRRQTSRPRSLAWR